MDVITISLIVGAITALVLGAIVFGIKLKANKENKDNKDDKKNSN